LAHFLLCRCVGDLTTFHLISIECIMYKWILVYKLFGQSHQRVLRGFDRWIYNQPLSPLMLWVRIPLRKGILDITLCDIVGQWLAADRWFSLGTRVSSTNKTYLHLTIEILLNVPLNIIPPLFNILATHFVFSYWLMIYAAARHDMWYFKATDCMLCALTLHDLKRKIVTVAISTTAKYQKHIPSKKKKKKRQNPKTWQNRDNTHENNKKKGVHKHNKAQRKKIPITIIMCVYDHPTDLNSY
jgi:hypothetical protein